MLPKAFHGLRVLRLANSVAVAAALASLTALSLESVVGHGSVISDRFRTSFYLLGLPTFLIGLAWATLFRLPRPRDKARPNSAWMACVPLAILNASASCAVLLMEDGGRGRLTNIAVGAFAGATFGAVIWIPALLATIGLFGLPLWRAQKLAERGLAGQERGERTVGVVSALLGAFGAIGSIIAIGTHAMPLLFGTTAVALGTLAAALASARERSRRVFVAQAEAGRVEGYRVDVVPEGKVLVRVVKSVETYRHAEQHEALVVIDPEGGAVQAVAERA